MNYSSWITVASLFTTLLLTGCNATRPPAATQPVTLSPEASPVKTATGTNLVPTLTPFLLDPEQSNRTAVIVCPGGGYGAITDTYEGIDVCRWWNQHGVAAFLLRYRVVPHRYPSALDDAQQAIRVIRQHAREYGVNPQRIGIMGFSAGGHLAADTAVEFNPDHHRADRPDFVILAYPVISMVAPYGHVGSRDNLIGPNPSLNLASRLSLESRVTADTPPCFLVHGRNDKIVDYRNSQLFYDACRAHGVPAQLLLLENGPHGFGLQTPPPAPMPWTEACVAFLQANHLLP
jgi:acetyl esterase/lipase